jgi:hypothetical protein
MASEDIAVREEPAHQADVDRLMRLSDGVAETLSPGWTQILFMAERVSVNLH